MRKLYEHTNIQNQRGNYMNTSVLECPDGIGLHVEWGKYKVGNWPGACWRPLSKYSPWNIQIPNNPTIVPNSGIYVNSILAKGGGYIYAQASPSGKNDWTFPLYFSQNTDPWFRLHCTQPWGTCEIEGKVIQIPQNAHAGGDGGACDAFDGSMVVIDQINNLEYDFWQLCPRTLPLGGMQFNPTDIYMSWGGMADISKLGDGTTPDSTPMVGTNGRAARTPLSAGLIRVAELDAGEISHALSLVVEYTNGTRVYPAGSGTGRKGGVRYPPMGQRFYLAMTPDQIDAIQTSNTNKIIYKALTKYGCYVADTGGGGFAVQVESDWSFTSFGYPGKIANSSMTKPYLTSWGTITLDHFPGTYLKAISPPIVTTGSINCISTPSSKIWLDGVNQNITTPKTLTYVPSGAHTVTFRLEGYQDCAKDIVVSTGTVSTSCVLSKI